MIDPSAFLSDRRAFPRLDCSIPVRVSDYHFEWEARALSISTGGAFVDTRQDFGPGQDIELTVIDEELGDEVILESQVRWCRIEGLGPHGVGVSFLERRTERLELLHDLVDRLAVVDVQTAARFRAAGQHIAIQSILFVARSAPRNPSLTNEERAFLSCIDGNTSIAEIQSQMRPEEFAQIAYAPFSLLAKGVITTSEAQGVKANRRVVGARRKTSPTLAAGRFSRQQTTARNAQAQTYYQQALEVLTGGDKRKAHTLLALALQLAPGDPEISAALESVADS